MKSASLCAVLACSAGVMSATNTFASWAANGVGATTAWPCVGMVGATTPNGDNFDCSGTVIGNGMFVLTAKHCVTTDGTITGPVRGQTDMRFKIGNTTYFTDSITVNPNSDLAIIKLRVMLSDAYQIYCPPAGTDQTGMAFVGVGFGLGSSNGGTATATWNLPYGIKREFNNTVDGIINGPLAGQGTVIDYSLTIPNGVNGEGTSAPGDSGGGVFYNINGINVLAGVISSGGNARPGQHASAVAVSEYKEWINANIPAPSASGLLALAGVVAYRRRRGA